jgi:DNA ligase (NAD+)
MNDALVRKDYLKKIRKIHKLNKAYYEDSVPVISDQEYDSLKQQIIDLENKYKFLKSKLSPSISVGFKPSKNFEKVKHKVPMLSLGNAFSEDDLKSFEKKIINFLSLKNTKIK